MNTFHSLSLPIHLKRNDIYGSMAMIESRVIKCVSPQKQFMRSIKMSCVRAIFVCYNRLLRCKNGCLRSIKHFIYYHQTTISSNHWIISTAISASFFFLNGEDLNYLFCIVCMYWTWKHIEWVEYYRQLLFVVTSLKPKGSKEEREIEKRQCTSTRNMAVLKGHMIGNILRPAIPHGNRNNAPIITFQ